MPSRIEALLSNESFIKYCEGDQEANAYWEEQLRYDPELKATTEKAKQWYALLKVELTDASMETIAFKKIIENKVAKAPLISMHTSKRWRFWIAASIGLLVILSGAWLYRHSTSDQPAFVHEEIPGKEKTDASPGRNTATLVLADGSVVSLDSARNGEIARQGNVQIVKIDNGGIVYKATGSTPAENIYNILSTPRGGEYQLTLPDGTKVWLNAASSIRYPASFLTHERRVTITGEVYFEVASVRHPVKKSALLPFIVEKDNLQVIVKGTHFNINAYDDEASMKVTLLEGKVLVASGPTSAGKKEVALVPGSQALSDASGRISLVKMVDLDGVMAWKNGLFDFSSADLRMIMRQLGRWYDLDCSFEGSIPDREFSGKISRNTKLSNVLRILEQSDIHFRIEHNRIVVTQ